MNNSKHSIERAHERFNMNREETIRFTSKALERGIDSKGMPKDERKYMEAKEMINNCKTLFYNGAFFIFDTNNVCITIYEAPKWFCKKRFYYGKKLLRNAKKYQNNYLPA